jgi:hypothetical protein
VYQEILLLKSFSMIATTLHMHQEAVRRHAEHLRFRSVRLTPAEINLLQQIRQQSPVTYEDHARTIG